MYRKSCKAILNENTKRREIGVIDTHKKEIAVGKILWDLERQCRSYHDVAQAAGQQVSSNGISFGSLLDSSFVRGVTILASTLVPVLCLSAEAF
jgi:hypothetical protein